MADSDKPNNEGLVLKQLKSIKVALWMLVTFIVIFPVIAGIGTGVVIGIMALTADGKEEGASDTVANTAMPIDMQRNGQNAELIEAKRAIFDNQSATQLEHVRRLNQDLIKAFIQNPNYIDTKTLRVQMSDEGLLLEFFNDPSRRLFDDGEADLTDYGKLLFGIVAWTLAKHDTALASSIEVEGHTGANFKETKDDNKWSISSKRALEVHKHMENEGVKDAQFHKMVGYGDTRPLKDQTDPEHPYHNRVSIMVRVD